jgi:tetratricopeptide (TPR) repeat protein
MNLSRLELLRQYVNEEPDDPFNWYSLVLEEQKADVSKADALYQQLLTQFPDYVPTYYQAGIFYMQLGNHDRALDILKKGVEKCEKANDQKTRREILSIIMEMED